MVSVSTARVDKTLHLPSSFKFAKWKKGSMDRSCQHLWFSEFDFLHDIESESLFCHTCHRYKDVLILLEKIGKQKQRAKCWHNRSKFRQNALI